MRPELLLPGSGWVPEIDALLEARFVCHRLAGLAPDARGAFLERARRRGPTPVLP